MTAITIAWVVAHPDDETFSSACAIAEAVRRGCRVALFSATTGEAGKSGYLPPMSRDELGARRRLELERAGRRLGVADIRVADYADGRVAEADGDRLTADIARFLSEQQAQVVVTFGLDGIYGHPDHIAVHHAVKRAVAGGRCPTVQKLYYFYVANAPEGPGVPSVVVDSSVHWKAKAEALLMHETQMKSIERVFGDVRNRDGWIAGMFGDEAFVLAWERGRAFPAKSEQFFTDGLP